MLTNFEYFWQHYDIKMLQTWSGINLPKKFSPFSARATIMPQICPYIYTYNMHI